MHTLKCRISPVKLLLIGLAVLAAAPVFAARPSPRNPRQPPATIGTVTISGTITSVNAAGSSFVVTDRNGLSATFKTTNTTVITLDGKSAALANLAAGDPVTVTYDRNTLVASRVVATSPPPVDLTGTITALTVNVVPNTVQVTTDHGTAVTLTVNNATTVRLNGALTSINRVMVGDQVRVTYRAADKIALTLSATTPQPNVVSGFISGLNLMTGVLQITPLVGPAINLALNAQTQFRLNGRTVAPGLIVAGDLATVQIMGTNTAAVVSAQTPPLVTLQATLTAINLAGGTITLTTPSATTITLRLSNTTAITRNGANAPASALKTGDQVVVQYEYLVVPNTSIALQITATGP